MDEFSPIRMVDILPLETVSESNSDILQIIVILILIVSLLYLFYRYYFNPLRILQRQLLQKSLQPRQVAHELSRLVNLDDSSSRQLQKLRFSKKEPQQQELILFFQMIRSSHYDG